MSQSDSNGKSDLVLTPSSYMPRLVQGKEPYELYTEGDDLYAAMTASMAAAKTSIRFEMYIFADDEIGRQFADVMVERAAAGVDVWLIIDSAGSLFWASNKLERYLRKNKVQVRWFHRWSWRSPYRYNRRNHRKLLVVDEQEVYLGGFNIHRENSRKLIGDARWRDTQVKLYGVYAEEVARLFDIFWQGKRRWIASREPRVNSLVPNHTYAWRAALRSLYAQVIRGAGKSVYLTTPYFVPDIRLQHDLMAAARRGIDVRILLPRKSDVWITKWAAWAAYTDLLNAGVRIYEYLPRVLHAKIAVVDGTWAILGTANLDYRSFFVNYELNVISRDLMMCEEIQAQFLTDLEESEEIIMKAWSGRPLIRHVAELVGWIARRWL